MSFLQPLLLIGLPLMLIPLIVHLIHLMRRRRVRWAAMMFLRKAERVNRGFSKLRQYLILAFRMLAVAALIFMVGRPLAGGLLGLTGGAPDSVIILLDRSASMEEQLLTTGTSKRSASLRNLSAALNEAYGKRTRLTLIDSATLTPIAVANPEALLELPQAGRTDTASDVPALLQAGLDFITTNQTGRTDLWLVSDLRQADWDAQGGRWPALRDGFASLEGVRFQVLAYPEATDSGLGVVVEQVRRRESDGKAELLLDYRIYRRGPAATSVTIPVRVVVNGTGSTLEVELTGSEVVRQAEAIPIDQSVQRGWGRIELPADGNPADNVFHFVFDRAPPLKSVIVSEAREEVILPIQAALTARADSSRDYECTVLPPSRAAEIEWDESALVVWHGPLPEDGSTVQQQMRAHLTAGRSLLFLPPAEPTDAPFEGVRWTAWTTPPRGTPQQVDWWRNDAGLLAATRAGPALPVGEINVQRWCPLEGNVLPLARLGDEAGNATLLARSVRDDGSGAWFLTTLPGVGTSSLARDGVVLFAALHRALQEGAAALGNALQRTAGRGSLGDDPGSWNRLDAESPLSIDRPLKAGVLERPSNDPDRPGMLVALNRDPGEDASQTLDRTAMDELFTGLDWRLLERSLEDDRSLTREVWRTFLILMAAALILEALLCMPSRARTARTVSARAVKGGASS